ATPGALRLPGLRLVARHPGCASLTRATRLPAAASPGVGDPAVHVRTVEAGRRLAAVRELVVVGVGGDGAVRVLVEQVVRAHGQRPPVARLEACRGVDDPLRAVGLVEVRVAALAHARGELTVAGRAEVERPAREVPVRTQGDLVARE